MIHSLDTIDLPKTILIVEDEENIALALRHLLLRKGYVLEWVADGDQALPLIRTLQPDLVLLDVMLPGLSGYEICQMIRMDDTLSHIKILMMSACGNILEGRKGIALGADAFIRKPFDLPALIYEIDHLIGKTTGETHANAP